MKTAKVFPNGRSQAVRLPKDFQFATDEVYINRVNDVLVLFPRDKGWEILPFENAAAVVYGRIRADLERAGNVIGPMDLLIAAHALSEHATVVTSNEREFRRVEGLVVENWL
jgi:virulence-associated protein VagC